MKREPSILVRSAAPRLVGPLGEALQNMIDAHNKDFERETGVKLDLADERTYDILHEALEMVRSEARALAAIRA